MGASKKVGIGKICYIRYNALSNITRALCFVKFRRLVLVSIKNIQTDDRQNFIDCIFGIRIDH